MKLPPRKSKFAPLIGGDLASPGHGLPVRPWSRQGVRLGLKLGPVSPGQVGTATLGWALLRMGPDVIAQGEAQVPAPSIGTCQPLTPAERRSLREDCGLSLREAAAWHQVNARTLSYWEEGRGAPRDDADHDLLMLRASLSAAASRAVDVACALRTEHPEVADQPVELSRYTPRDYPLTQQAHEGLPHGAHSRLLTLTADALAVAGIRAEIVYRGAGQMCPSTDPEAGGWETEPPAFANRPGPKGV